MCRHISAQTATSSKTARDKGIIDEALQEKLLELNRMRSDFVHGLDSSVHTRPQAKDPLTNAFMWTKRAVMTAEIETRAKRALEILFKAERKLHYSKLNYY